MAEVRPNYMRLRAPRRRLDVEVLLGEGSPTPSGGTGGWEVVPRPQRRPLTVWRGPSDAFRVTIPVLFDRFAEQQSVEAACRDLQALAGRDQDDRKPAPLVIDGVAPYDVTNRPNARWAIESLEWGEAIRLVGGGPRIRQAVTIALIELEEDDVLQRLKPRRKNPPARKVPVKKGDTFEKLAARHLDSKKLGGRLAKLNGYRSPDVKLKPGKKIKLPTTKQLNQWWKDLRRRRK